MAEASEQWAGQIDSRFSERTSAANHDFEGAEKFISGASEKMAFPC